MDLGKFPEDFVIHVRTARLDPQYSLALSCLLTVYARSLCPTVLTLLEYLYLKCGPFSPPSPPFATPVPSMADPSTRNPEQMVLTQDHSPRTTQPHAAHLGRESWPGLLSLSPRARTNAGLWDF